jgi:hypothetical protein
MEQPMKWIVLLASLSLLSCAGITTEEGPTITSTRWSGTSSEGTYTRRTSTQTYRIELSVQVDTGKTETKRGTKTSDVDYRSVSAIRATVSVGAEELVQEWKISSSSASFTRELPVSYAGQQVKVTGVVIDEAGLESNPFEATAALKP